MNKHKALISELSSGLTPVSPTGNVNLRAVAWFFSSAIFVVAVTLLYGPMRPGVLSQLTTEPRFLVETLLGAVAIFWFCLLAFRSSVPAGLGRTFLAVGMLLMVLWLSQYVLGFISPALEPSSFGKRNY